MCNNATVVAWRHQHMVDMWTGTEIGVLMNTLCHAG